PCASCPGRCQATKVGGKPRGRARLDLRGGDFEGKSWMWSTPWSRQEQRKRPPRMFQIDVSRLPLEYWYCVIVLVLAGLFGVRMRREPWAAPFIAVLATIAGWYMVEPVYFPD